MTFLGAGASGLGAAGMRPEPVRFGGGAKLEGSFNCDIGTETWLLLSASSDFPLPTRPFCSDVSF
jgi:hypothetical protein